MNSPNAALVILLSSLVVNTVASEAVLSTDMQLTSAGDDAPAALGMRLFADSRLSRTRTISCATCHVPQKAFSDGLPIAIGANGQRGTRNTPSLWNVATLPNQFWDGRRASLEEQALDPLLNPREHGIPDQDALLAIVRSDEKYRAGFKSAFNIAADQITARHIATALAAFERTLISNPSDFDRYYYQGERIAMSASAIRGFELFTGRAGCAICHTIEGSRAHFTDHKFHSLGVSLDSVRTRLAELTQRVATTDQRMLDQLIAADPDIAALGRFALTKDPRDIGKFRTPSLRNVALTDPYMHDGSVATLEAAINSEVYYRSLEQNRPLILTPSERTDLIAFLKALTSANAQSYSFEPSNPEADEQPTQQD